MKNEKALRAHVVLTEQKVPVWTMSMSRPRVCLAIGIRSSILRQVCHFLKLKWCAEQSATGSLEDEIFSPLPMYHQ